MSELKKINRLEAVEYYLVAANGSSCYCYNEEEIEYWTKFYHKNGYEAYVFKKVELPQMPPRDSMPSHTPGTNAALGHQPWCNHAHDPKVTSCATGRW